VVAGGVPVSFSTQSPATDSAVVDLDDAPRRRLSTETKASFKTTEFYAYLGAVVGVLMASQLVAPKTVTTTTSAPTDGLPGHATHLGGRLGRADDPAQDMVASCEITVHDLQAADPTKG
jgi:hypothetical protein